jgi:UMF1 family MFS transporter
MVTGLPMPGSDGMEVRPLLSTEGGWHIRATNLLVAVWFLLFSLPFFLRVRDRGTRMLAQGESSVRAAFAQLAGTLRRLRQYRQVALFLVARLVYNDGLVTIFAFGAIYAGAALGMSQSEILRFAIVVNVAAGLGAIYFGRQDDRIGARATIVVSLVGLLAACVLAVAAPALPAPKAWFYVAGVGIGLMAGPNQSASRSLMGRFVPERHHAEFFGFFAFSGKLTAFVGPLALGAVTALTGSHRLGFATLLPLFAGGLVLLLLVDEKEGIRVARTADGSPAEGLR